MHFLEEKKTKMGCPKAFSEVKSLFSEEKFKNIHFFVFLCWTKRKLLL